MRVILEKPNTTPKNFLRACGYLEIANPHKDNEISYARSLDPGRFYPRFHIYIESENKKNLALTLHLDAKKPSYEGTAAHSGEYEGEVVEQEAERIRKVSERFKPELPGQPLGFQKEKSLWERLANFLKRKNRS
jgi:hypothetical protein